MAKYLKETLRLIVCFVSFIVTWWCLLTIFAAVFVPLPDDVTFVGKEGSCPEYSTSHIADANGFCYAG